MKARRKYLNVFILLVFFVGLFFNISCEDSVPNPTTGTLTLGPAIKKELTWSANTQISEYVYKATPLFTGTATGKTSDWQHLSYGGAGTIGELTQGKWLFELAGRNSNGSTITTGSIEAYIEAGKENVISIEMKTDPSIGEGTIKYNIWTQNVSSEGSELKVYAKDPGKTEWVLKNKQSSSGNPPIFSGVIEKRKAGYDEILFMLFDKSGALLGGEQIGLQVVSGEATAVSGIIEPSNEITFDLSIKSMGHIHAELDPDSGIETTGEGRDKTAYIERGDSITFTWKDLEDATSHPTEWIWALDGEVISNSKSSYTVKYDEYGEHELSVIGLRRDNEGVLWDVGSAVIRIVVVKHLCEVTFDANGGFFSDGKDINVILQDTTIESERRLPGGIPYDGLSPQKTGYRLTGWRDATTGKKIVDILSDGTVKFLDGYATKEPTRTLKALWEPGIFTVSVIWYDNVTVNNKAVKYTETYTVKSADKLTFLNPSPKRQGFKFLSYTTEENSRGDTVKAENSFSWGKDITIWANWEYVPITVQYYKAYSDYKAGISPYKTTIVGSDLRYGALPQPLRQGKVFKGWAHPEDVDGAKIVGGEGGKSYLRQDALKSGKNFVTVSDRVTEYSTHSLVAVWGDGDIKISFNYGDYALTEKGKASIGEFAIDNGIYYKYGSLGTQYGALPFTGLETLVREGQEFIGWFDSPTYNMQVYEVFAVTNNQDHTLYAKWEGQKLVVSFDTGTEEKLDTKQVRLGGLYGTLPEITKVGYKFEGWTYNGKKITEESIVEEKSNHTLRASWTPLKTQLTLSLSGGSYSYPDTMSLDYDAEYGSAKSGDVVFKENGTTWGLKEPSRYGYDFNGWFQNPTGNGNAVKSTQINKNENSQTLYALWKAHRHNITFYNNWPKVDETKTKPSTSKKENIPFGTSYGDLPSLTVTGYTFNGWYTSQTNGEQVSATTKYLVDNDISLYAKWSVIKVNISFYDDGVVCKDKDGKTIEPITREWGTQYGTLPEPYKKGYKFTGRWRIVGRKDASGNDIYISSSTIIKDTVDVTLNPEWEPEKVLVLVPYNAQASTDGVFISVDWSKYKSYEVTFGETFNNLRDATISSGKWTATANASLPTWTRTGYWQDSWVEVINNTSYTITDSSALVSDYGTLESTAKAKFGTISPENVIYFYPNWKENEYVITFKSRLETKDSISDASSAPYIASKTGKYNEVFSSVISNTESTTAWIQSWDGYVCEGIYTDSTLTKEVKLTDKIGTEIVPTKDNELILYVKWSHVRKEYSLNTSDTDQYGENSKFRLFRASEAFSGSNKGFWSGQSGWYNFSGDVDENHYTKIRIASEDLLLMSVTQEGEKAISLPANMNIKVHGVASVYTVSEKCLVCNGSGQTGIVKSNFSETSDYYTSPENTMKDYNLGSYDRIDKSYRINYRASTMYDFCPNACKNWSNHNKGYWVTCPNCNGNPESVHNYGWKIYHFVCSTCNGAGGERTSHTCTACGGGGGSEASCSSCGGTGKVAAPNDCPKCKGTGKISGGNVECPNCSGSGSLGTIYLNCPKCDGSGATTSSCTRCGGTGVVSSFVSCSNCKGEGRYDEAYYYDYQCYCVWQSKNKGGELRPGQIWLSGYRFLRNEKGQCKISVNNQTKVSGDFDTTIYCGNNSTVKATMTPYVLNANNIVVELSSVGKIEVRDNAGDYSSRVALAGTSSGKILSLYFDHYTQANGAYFYTNGTGVGSVGTPYYAYKRALTINQYNSSNVKVASEESSSSGYIDSSKIDTSLPCSFRAVTDDGTEYSGTPTIISWTDEFVEVTYTQSNGRTGVFRWLTRADSETITSPVCKSFNLSVWAQEGM